MSRTMLLFAAAGCLTLGGASAQEDKAAADAEREIAAFAKSPEAKTCRRIDFETAEVRPGIVGGTWILVVRGQKPCANMAVELVAYVYVRQPEYWEIEVVACLKGGICLPAQTPFTAALPLAGVTGTKGVQVVGATKTKKIDVPPR